MQTILGLKFREYGQVYFFSLPKDTALPKPGDFVIAETGHGPSLAKLVSVSSNIPSCLKNQEIKPILRLVTEKDSETIKNLKQLESDALNFCASCIARRELDMKLIDVEILFDKSKYVFYFTAPTRIDFRELVKDLVREYHSFIELRQISVRQETRMVGALGNCGMTCCCRRFLHNFTPVSIKMAKDQNLFLNPGKISGVCGRLLCCLAYEQENYESFKGASPRPGTLYKTSLGDMKVLRINMFRGSVTALNAAGEEVEFSLEEWQTTKPCPYCQHEHTGMPDEPDMAEEESPCESEDWQ